MPSSCACISISCHVEVICSVSRNCCNSSTALAKIKKICKLSRLPSGCFELSVWRTVPFQHLMLYFIGITRHAHVRTCEAYLNLCLNSISTLLRTLERIVLSDATIRRPSIQGFYSFVLVKNPNDFEPIHNRCVTCLCTRNSGLR